MPTAHEVYVGRPRNAQPSRVNNRSPRTCRIPSPNTGLPVPSWTLHRSCAALGPAATSAHFEGAHARADVCPAAVAAGRPRAKPQHLRGPSPTPPPGGASDPPGHTGQHGDRCGSHQPGHEARPSSTDTQRAATCALQDAGRANSFHRPCHHYCPPPLPPLVPSAASSASTGLSRHWTAINAAVDTRRYAHPRRRRLAASTRAP